MKQGTKKKILLLLLGGVALGLTRSPKKYFKILKISRRAWKEINRDDLIRSIKEFYTERLVEYKENEDGTINIVLTENGKKLALKYDLDNLEIKQKRPWDKTWRLVFFDIPEKKKGARNALRNKLRDLGFHQIQKSIFVLPYECEDEINFIVEVLDVRPYVRFARVGSLTNEAELKLKFKLH